MHKNGNQFALGMKIGRNCCVTVVFSFQTVQETSGCDLPDQQSLSRLNRRAATGTIDCDRAAALQLRTWNLVAGSEVENSRIFFRRADNQDPALIVNRRTDRP